MRRLRSLLPFFTCQSGGSLTEFVFLAALIAIVAIAGMRTIRDKCDDKLHKTANEIARVR